LLFSSILSVNESKSKDFVATIVAKIVANKYHIGSTTVIGQVVNGDLLLFCTAI
jgi:hypothetical protein